MQNSLILGLSGGRAVEVAGIAVRNLLAGSCTAAVVFLLIERTIRPLYVATFAGGQDRHRSNLTLRMRLVLAWVTGSAVPLLLFGSVLFGRSAGERAELAGYGWLYVLLGLVAGAGMTLVMAGSIANPVEQLRSAVADVDAGDLEVHVAVDDGTEIGQLQHGFNRMVDGLRERRRLHELFGRHVGEEVARQALAGRAHLGGERCEATALFVDLTGSTGLGERSSPEEVVDILNQFFAEVVAAVTAEGGWVNKFEGDAALCVFGPPVGHDDHADRALRAAVAMRGGSCDSRRAIPTSTRASASQAGVSLPETSALRTATSTQ